MRHNFELLLRPFQYLELLLSFLTPRNKKIWCFGSSFNGNTKFLFIYMNELKMNRCVWIAKGDEVNQIRELGFEAYKKSSLKGKLLLLTAGVYVYNSYISNVGAYTWGRVKKVNLWHGVGLKNIEYEMNVGPIAKRYYTKGPINALRYMPFRVKPDILLTTSPMMTRHFTKCFRLNKDAVIEGIYPRCELFNKTNDELFDYIQRYETQSTANLAGVLRGYRFVYIYMPTFRDSGDDFISNCGFNFDLVNRVLMEDNRLLIMKMHPDSKLVFKKEYSNIQIVEKDVDIYPILPLTHCLITDYSSIYFDYILMKDKPIILFIPDLENYLANSRDLAFPYEDYTKGIVANDFDSLIALFKTPIQDYVMPEIETIRKAFWAPSSKNMSELVSGIVEKLN